MKTSWANFAVGGGSVWSFGKAHGVQGIHRVEPNTGKCIATIALKPRKGISWLAYGEGSLWVLSEHDGNLVRIDPATNQVSATIELGKGFWEPPQFTDGAVWSMGSETGVIERVDPQSNKIVDRFLAGSPQKNGFFSDAFGKGGWYSFSTGDGMLWVADRKDAYSTVSKYFVFRIDPRTHESRAPIEIDDSNGPPAFWNNYLWVSTVGYRSLGPLTMINPKTNEIAGRTHIIQSCLEHEGWLSPLLLLADENSLWTFAAKMNTRDFVVCRIRATSVR